MAKRAVLIGINYVGTDNQLRGCINDIMDMKNMLINSLGFDESDIQLVFDEGNEGDYDLPTCANIQKHIQEAVAASEDGDVLFIHYSGHGSYRPDESGEEADGQDEMLVSADLLPVTDDALKSWLSQLSAGVKLTFIADCCHSGSLLDQPQQDVQIDGEKDQSEETAWEVEGEAANKSISWEQYVSVLQSNFDGTTFMQGVSYVNNSLADDVEADNPYQWIKAVSAQSSGGDVSHLEYCVLITGCEDNQTSADACFGNRYNGALTKTLLTVFNSSEGVPSYRELVSKTRAKLAGSYEQNPCLVCPDGVASLSFVDMEEASAGQCAAEEY